MAFDLEQLKARFADVKSLESAAHAKLDRLMADTAQVLAETVPYDDLLERAVDALESAARWAHQAIDRHPQATPAPAAPEPVAEPAPVTEPPEPAA